MLTLKRMFGVRTVVRGFGVGLTGIGVGSATLWPSMRSDGGDDQPRFFPELYCRQRMSALRAFRAAFAASRLGLEYSRTLPKDSPAYESRHQRGAVLLRSTCEKNGGVYVKLGQMLAQLDHILPEAYTQELRALLNKCPPRSWSLVEPVLNSELSQRFKETSNPIGYCFESIDYSPIATASLAQVHKAQLSPEFGGHKVAIKIQHRSLAETSVWDVKVVKFLLALGAERFELLSKMRWLGDELASSLKHELDFEQEAKNCIRCGDDLRNGSLQNAQQNRFDVVVPKVYEELSSKKVLVCSWEEGVAVDDRESIIKMGLDPAEVSKLLAQTFAEQIFVHGFVHCDPHAQNLFVRVQDGGAARLKSKRLRPQLVMLDHGLYRELSRDLQLKYSELWQAIVFGDGARIKETSAQLGVVGETNIQMLAMMLTLRPWDQVSSSRKEGESMLLVQDALEVDDEVRKRVQDFVAEHAVRIGDVLDSIPREMLLLFKTSDCLRAIERALKAPWSWYEATARISAQVVDERDLQLPREKNFRWHTIMDAISNAVLGKTFGIHSYRQLTTEIRIYFMYCYKTIHSMWTLLRNEHK